MADRKKPRGIKTAPVEALKALVESEQLPAPDGITVTGLPVRRELPRSRVRAMPFLSRFEILGAQRDTRFGVDGEYTAEVLARLAITDNRTLPIRSEPLQEPPNDTEEGMSWREFERLRRSL